MVKQTINETDLNQKIEQMIADLKDKLMNDLQEPEILIEALKREENDEASDMDYTLASGLAGFISLLSQIKGSSPDFEEYAYKTVVLLNQMISQGKVNHLSLWGGLTGIAASVYLLSDGKNYTNFVSQLNDLILENVDVLIQSAASNLSEGRTTSFDFETVYGLAGIARYLLLLIENEQAKHAMNEILDFFIQLNHTAVDDQENRIPGYFITRHNQFDHDAKQYPGGHFNLGLAHGICGPLTIMALAFEQGYERAHLSDTVMMMADELVSWAQEDETGIWWPAKVNYDEYISKTVSNSQKDVNGWCYGTPGVARTLWICGRALNNEKYKQLALTAFQSLSCRNVEELNIISPTFCHGLAGLIHLTHLMYMETLDDELLAFRNQLIERLLKERDETSLLGYQDLSYDGEKRTTIGLLDGISGIYIVLHSILMNQKPAWSFIYLTD